MLLNGKWPALQTWVQILLHLQCRGTGLSGFSADSLRSCLTAYRLEGGNLPDKKRRPRQYAIQG